MNMSCPENVRKKRLFENGKAERSACTDGAEGTLSGKILFPLQIAPFLYRGIRAPT